MTNRQKHIASAVGTGMVWGFAWSFIGTAVMGLLGIDVSVTVNMITPYSGMGLIGGAAFSLNRRRFDEISIPRFAAWGAIAGLVLSVLGLPVVLSDVPVSLVTAGIATLLGAGSAAGSLALARRVDEMSLPYFAACGAVVGIVLSIPSWNLTTTSYVLNAAIVGVLALMCAGGAAGLLALARNARARDLLEAGGSTGNTEGQ